MSSRAIIGIVAALFAGSAGCASKQRPPEQRPAQPAAVSEPITIHVVWRKVTHPTAVTTRRTSIVVDAEVARRCNIPDAYFPFDSAKLNERATGALDALARCFTEGALKGRSMKIVGHADPRGPDEYNFALGQRRANNVAAYLTQKGLSEEKVSTSSLGEREAEGENEAGWARDRKVEILLAEEAIVIGQ